MNCNETRVHSFFNSTFRSPIRTGLMRNLRWVIEFMHFIYNTDDKKKKSYKHFFSKSPSEIRSRMHTVVKSHSKNISWNKLFCCNLVIQTLILSDYYVNMVIAYFQNFHTVHMWYAFCKHSTFTRRLDLRSKYAKR